MGTPAYTPSPEGVLPLAYYQGLLTHQYVLSPKLNAFMTYLLQKLDDVTTCLSTFPAAFDLDTAVGVQLDMLGTIAGAKRTVGFQPSGGVSPVLDDATYRIYIKAKIAQNQWDGMLLSLYPIWAQLFPSGTIVVQDNQNMTANIVLTGAFTSIIYDLISNGYIVPRPEGVEYTYDFGTLPYFGFGSAAGYIAGFDTGHWAG